MASYVCTYVVARHIIILTHRHSTETKLTSILSTVVHYHIEQDRIPKLFWFKNKYLYKVYLTPDDIYIYTYSESQK